MEILAFKAEALGGFQGRFAVLRRDVCLPTISSEAGLRHNLLQAKIIEMNAQVECAI